MLLSDYRKLCMPPEISARILPFGKFAQLSGSRTECSWWLLQSNQNHQDRGYQDTFDVYDNLNMLVSQISASNMPHLLPNNAVYFAPQHASFAANAAAAACSTDSSRHSHTWRKIGIKIGENKCKSGQAYAKILRSQHVVPGDPRVRSYHDLPKYIGQPGDVINANVAVENAVQNDCERLTSTRAFCIYVYLEMLVDDKCHIMFQKLSQSQKLFFSLRWPFCRQWHFPRLIEVHPNQAIRVQIFQLHQKVYFQRMSLLILTWSDWAVMKHQLYVVLWWCWCPRHMIYLSSWPCYHDQMENNGMLHAWKFLRHCPSS